MTNTPNPDLSRAVERLNRERFMDCDKWQIHAGTVVVFGPAMPAPHYSRPVEHQMEIPAVLAIAEMFELREYVKLLERQVLDSSLKTEQDAKDFIHRVTDSPSKGDQSERAPRISDEQLEEFRTCTLFPVGKLAKDLRDARAEIGELRERLTEMENQAGSDRADLNIALLEIDRLRAELAVKDEAAKVLYGLAKDALNVGGGLTNYVEDRPELHSAEREMEQIERALLAAHKEK